MVKMAWRKIKQKRGGGAFQGRVVLLKRVFRKGLADKQRPEGESPVRLWGKNSAGRGTRLCKRLDAGEQPVGWSPVNEGKSPRCQGGLREPLSRLAETLSELAAPEGAEPRSRGGSVAYPSLLTTGAPGGCRQTSKDAQAQKQLLLYLGIQTGAKTKILSNFKNRQTRISA